MHMPSPSAPGTQPSTNAARELSKKRIFIVEDHPIFRHGLVQLINGEPDLEVVGDASSAPQAMSALREKEADVVILDVSLRGANGIELLKHLRAEHRTLPMLVLSMHDESLYALRALRAGASGYLMKRETPEVLLAALRKVAAGEIYVSANFGEELIFKVVRGSETGGSTALDSLTDREIEVLQLVGEGRSSRQIADELHLSTKTIESHRLHIKEKLGLHSANELVRFAVDWVSQQQQAAV
jgi:DNA-binding NarL/FixJ family response regulator